MRQRLKFAIASALSLTGMLLSAEAEAMPVQTIGAGVTDNSGLIEAQYYRYHRRHYGFYRPYYRRHYYGYGHPYYGYRRPYYGGYGYGYGYRRPGIGLGLGFGGPYIGF